MACGTGKTLVALWAVEQSKAKSILVLLPSLTLLQQTLSEWSAHNSWGKDFSYLCVCSDPQVDLKNDEIEIDSTDVPFKIDTDPEIVKSYLSQENGKIKIVFSTYQSSQVVSQATKDHVTFDIGVFDEAHKTTGAGDGRFALALKDENISIKKRLFFTATPKHYDIKKRNKDGEFKFVSMDDESVYGSRAHTLSFSQAADQGIICPYKVVVILIDKQQVDDFALKNGITLIEGDAVKAKWVASQVAISSAVKHTNAKKIITFHTRVKTAREFASDEFYGIKKFLPNFDVFHVHGKQRSNERKDTISKFKASSSSLITNAKCLTEGVDVPAVDMVAFVDPRHSKIDIAQAVGRAMRKPRGGSKKLGYIVVPLYAEDTNEQSLEAAIQSEGFDNVALIINSLLEQDSELTEIVIELKQANGRREVFNPQRLKEKIEVIGPYVDLEQLQTSIFTQTVERLGSSWDEWYGILQNYKEREGHCLVPHEHIEIGSRLGFWVATQREARQRLSSERIQKLEFIGFTWSPLDEKWETGFYALNQFKNREGNCFVGDKYLEGQFKLGQWVGVQRLSIDSLSIERRQRLDSIGFVWDPHEAKWEEGFAALTSFKNREGNCLVNYKHMEGSFRLGQWVAVQRSTANSMNVLRKNKLNAIGFSWDPQNDKWENGFNAYILFKQRYGNELVAKEFVIDGYPLGQWIGVQRQSKTILSAERISRLDEHGFIWNARIANWEVGFNALVEFYKREAHIKVPQNHVEGSFNLGIWIANNRKRKHGMTASQIAKLNEIPGWSWN
jgi:superfamily II DNA or RNA helicase